MTNDKKEILMAFLRESRLVFVEASYWEWWKVGWMEWMDAMMAF